MLKDIKSNFSTLIDLIIYYDSINEDDQAWDLIYKIEELGHPDEIELLLSDFNSRDLSTGPTFLYNAILYGLVNNPDSKLVLINILKKGDYAKFKAHLQKLDKGKVRDGDLNAADVINQLNADSMDL